MCIPRSHSAWRAASCAAACSLLLAPAFAAEPVYHEARIYVTAPPASAPPSIAPLASTVAAPVNTVAPAPPPAHLLSDRGFVAFSPLEEPDEDIPTILVDDRHSFQTIIGFGGAFTDAAADVFARLPNESQEQFLEACFDPDTGNGYTLCRTTIHSCDYAQEMYTYAEVPGDKALEHFTIERDRKNRIPFIKRAQAAAKDRLLLYASPWSPPGWMKTNGEMKHGGTLKPEYMQTWADYFVKYVKAYEAEGIPIWGLTVQNEALATQVWESLIFTANEERDFVKNFLGPTLHKAGLQGVKLMIWDHNRGVIFQRVQPSYDDPQASKYIWGAAFHWYVGDHWDNIRLVHDAWPDKHLLFTEGATGGTWQAALRLSKNIIKDLQNWTDGWNVWNLMLDQDNGPRHAGGIPGVRGSTIVNANTATGEITYNPPHYVLGQFSRFIRPGAKRIACTSNNDGFVATAARNTDGRIAVVALNLEDREKFLRVWLRGKYVKYTCPANATVTFVIDPA